ncbi:hypothetical protein X798_06253 [Onchocerca flexuosa]|uniref:Uncharacterized protein n=2 Tax=Onchocerca flexuosa TaxID=387005 RepID=A0A183I2M8_9BILA|nr:hypothetical protein X798_06400 [Onchocerca flexuosa]OZC06749.1 hypothetical protein X798_06253 [Onchocerca flexuosa]VDP15203.1 unnamed protein product [Onchocerca flexuosa]
MSEEEVGRMKSARRRIFGQYRDVIIDDILEWKQILLNLLFKWRIGNYLWMIIAIGIFHLKLLYAITYPLHSFVIKELKNTICFNGEERQPHFSLYKAAMIFVALSVFWHCFTWPNPMSALQWNFSVRPQFLVAKSHSAPQIISTSCLDQMETKSQSETVQCKMNGKADLGIDMRLKKIILDSILTVYETIIHSLWLASEFAANLLDEFI